MKTLALYGGEPVRREPYKILPQFDETEYAGVEKILRSGDISDFGGQYAVKEFESSFAKYLGVDFAVALNSGTAALHTAFVASGMKPGDEAIVPPFTFISTVSPLLQIGVRPVFSDIDRDSYCLDPAKIEEKITPRTKAVIPVQLYGNIADMKDIVDVSKRNGLSLIEDAAQAHGADMDGRFAGTFGDVGAFSFAQNKNMTTGEGGMLVTNDSKIYTIAKLLRQNGKSNWRTHDILGYNYRMTEMQAAIGVEQVKKLPEMNRERREIANIYYKNLRGTDFTLPSVRKGVNHVYFKFPILVPERFKDRRDLVVKAIKAENVPVEVGYPYPLYEINFLSEFRTECPVAEDVCSRVINLFTGPSMQSDVGLQTAEAVKKVYNYLLV